MVNRRPKRKILGALTYRLLDTRVLEADEFLLPHIAMRIGLYHLPIARKRSVQSLRVPRRSPFGRSRVFPADCPLPCTDAEASSSWTTPYLAA